MTDPLSLWLSDKANKIPIGPWGKALIDFIITYFEWFFDGIKVGLQNRDRGVPLVCLETALPIKFEDTIQEALGRKPSCPARFQGLEACPQHVTVLPPETARVKAFIETHA